MRMPLEAVDSPSQVGDVGDTIVAGYDGSAGAVRALAEAAERAGPAGRVIVVHAGESPADWLDSPFYESALAAQRRRRRRILDGLRDLDLGEVALDVQFVEGPAAEALAAEARAHGAREIVVGSRRLGRLRAALGSVSLRLLRQADRPVIVVPDAPAAQEEPAQRRALARALRMGL
jgi:nucleotide-binding universal stress UspA family protein